MDNIYIILLCSLILLSYVFDLTAHLTKIPSMVLLLIIGLVVRMLAYRFNIHLPVLDPLLPILGTIGLVLIVLDGALEIELGLHKLKFIGRTISTAFLSIAIFCAIFALIIHKLYNAPYTICLINAIPFAVISSSVAIPTAQILSPTKKEFIVYESSFSDILGIIIFNFLLRGNNYLTSSVKFSAGVIAIIAISAVASLFLGFLLNRITHSVKFLPILTILVFLYAASKAVHLPALIMVLIFGLFINNSGWIMRIEVFKSLGAPISADILKSFKQVVGEFTFLVRSFFFLIFGYLINLYEIASITLALSAAAIVILALSARAGVLSALKVPKGAVLYIAPRGLISILLFLSIPEKSRLYSLNKELLTLVIVFSAAAMAIGLARQKKKTVFDPLVK